MKHCRWSIGMAIAAMATSVTAFADTPGDGAATKSVGDKGDVANPSRCRLAIVIPMESDVDGLEIELDGAIVPRGSYGEAIEVELPIGSHFVMARAPGRLEWSTRLRTDPSFTTVTVTIPRLAPNVDAANAAVPATALAAPALPVARLAVPANPADSRARDDGTLEWTVGYVLGGVGIASLAAGTCLAFEAIEMRRDARSPYSQEGLLAADRQAGVATAFITIGILSSVGAAAAFLVAPSDSPPARRAATLQVAPGITPGGGSVVAVGRF